MDSRSVDFAAIQQCGTIIAPVADADGRRAVLYMALQLLAMPDFIPPTCARTF
jgi:hypothetical protein